MKGKGSLSLTIGGKIPKELEGVDDVMAAFVKNPIALGIFLSGLLPDNERGILRFGGIVTLPEIKEVFSLADSFCVNTNRNASLQINSIGEFLQGLLCGEGDPVKERKLVYYDSFRDSEECGVVTELGGENRIATSFVDLFFLIKKQGRGQPGVLRTNGNHNLFYIDDCVVGCSWDKGWNLGTYASGIIRKTNAGERTFTRL